MDRKSLISVVLMFTMPIITLVQSFQVSNKNFKRWSLILFITIYGSVINLTPGTDGYVHQSNVDGYYSEVTFARFLSDTFDIITFTTNFFVQEDLYIHFLSYLCAGILGLPGLFFIFVAFIYGYFYAGSLFKLIKILPNFKYSPLFFGFLTLFVLYKGLEGINTVRTWTGLWVLFYGVLSYAETKKFKYLLLTFVTPYIHVGYFAMALPTWFVLIFGNWPRIFSVLFFLSFSFNLINPATITEKLEETEVGKEKVKAYYVEEEVSIDSKLAKSQERGSQWYKAYAKAGYHLMIINVLVIILIVKGYYPYRMNFVELNLIGVGMLTKVLSSFTWFLFALSNRSATIAAIFILGAFISMAQRGAFNTGPNNQIPKFEALSFRFIFIGLSPFLILKISELGEFISLFMLSAPFIVWFDSEMNISIKEAFKALIGF